MENHDPGIVAIYLNAFQAMDEEGGTLKLGLSEVQGFQAGDFSSSRNGVVFSAEDDGKGMSEEQVELIFGDKAFAKGFEVKKK